MKARRFRCLYVFMSLLVVAPVAGGQPVRPSDLFEKHVRPTLTRHCIKCHGKDKQEGGLRLTTIAGLLQGGDSGPAIVPGQPGESLLLEAIRYESFEMPPAGQLASDVAEGIASWIEADAYWPPELVLKSLPKNVDQDRDWWCYQPITNPAIPQVDDDGWCRNPIDHFIFDRLRREGITPSREAEPAKLVRRVHFAITGLPPDETAMSSVTGRDWYETLVDRLLQETAYGENQARYWLDLVRYADSDGYNADHSRPEAHHYRDYVIRSFNEDKPYDRFVQEQLAGDEIDPGNRDALIGTMYLRHWIYEWNQRDVEGQWRQILNDVTETTADVFLAQGMKCARCHDHKFDPLLQRDYYAMQAYFAPLYPREDQPIADLQTRTRHFEQQRAWEAATEDLRSQLHAIEMPALLGHVTREPVAKFTREIQSMIASRRVDRSPYQQQIASLASNQFDVYPDKLAEWLDEETNAQRQHLLEQLAEFDHLKPAPLPTMKFVVSDVGPEAPPTIIPGSADRSPIAPGNPTILADGPAAIQPVANALQSTGRRTSLARWITSHDNPLTARVIVNRLWQQHFGRGLVATASDFGRLGTPPSHPQLLDWLASRFQADGWSLKRLHRLILTSAAYRQTSGRDLDEHLATTDPQNTLLWRMNPRRLSGEEIHDSVLTACGEMSQGKRAIYKPVKRNRLDPFLAAFDFPDRVESQSKRHQTNTSPQALMMMNDPWLHDRAKQMVRHVGSMSRDSLTQTAYQRLFSRQPSRTEQQAANQFLEAYHSITPEPERPQLVESLPDGRPAISLIPEHTTSIVVSPLKQLGSDSHDGDFTIEATVVLRSLYSDASVRTIAAAWNGDKQNSGWALGVTSAKSAYRPRNLILQLVGSNSETDGRPHYEVVASGLRLELNKPYYLAVVVDLDDSSEGGITFYLHDLAEPAAAPLTAQAVHSAVGNVHADVPIEIGGRSNHHRWDGLIHNVRVHAAALPHEQLPVSVDAGRTAPSQNLDSQLLLDARFASDRQWGHDVSGRNQKVTVNTKEVVGSPDEQARVALLHTLFSTNEMIYVD